jgi:hypothetical protein
MLVSAELHAPAALSHRKQPRYPFLGGWVGPMAGLDEGAKEKSLVHTGNRTRLLGRPIRFTGGPDANVNTKCENVKLFHFKQVRRKFVSKFLRTHAPPFTSRHP